MSGAAGRLAAVPGVPARRDGVSGAGGAKEAVVGDDFERFWAALPPKAEHPWRVPMLESFRWIGEPLSALDTVDLLEGELDMWEAAHHLGALEALGVLERMPSKPRRRQKRDDGFDIEYRLKRDRGGSAA